MHLCLPTEWRVNRFFIAMTKYLIRGHLEEGKVYLDSWCQRLTLLLLELGFKAILVEGHRGGNLPTSLQPQGTGRGRARDTEVSDGMQSRGHGP